VKIELKPFQEKAARDMREHLDEAWYGAARGHAQAIILSSPTGSGKTATVTALMEWIYQGYDAYPPDRQAVFLWLSDSPELNQQSREKIQRQSSVFFEHDLVTIEPPFSHERLEAGKIYFLNIQKLGKDSLLTKAGDGRDFTIWQTIQNTAELSGQHFYVVIDEAHRGMNEKPREAEQAASIIQRFIKGYPEGGLEPLKLIIGMSATPERFQKLVQGTGRIVRPVEISPEDVKTSGLLKDKIVLFYPDDDQPADWSLLEQSVRHWQRFAQEWRDYCTTQSLDTVTEPVLVIQVESGTKETLTHTDLTQLVNVVERVTGRLPEGAWAHAFQEDRDIEAGGQKIRKIEASKIESDPLAKVVLFKMSLTTGWDCPRAEVLMSFRRAQDYTYIAQLVGRMVRTPLARSIEANDFLNTVSLFLPHYDENGLKAILNKLNNPDPETGVAVEVETGANLVYLEKDPAKAPLFEKLATLKTYRVERMEKAAPVPRLMKLARQLTAHDEIDKDAHGQVKALIVDTLTQELTRLAQSPDFIGNVQANQEIVTREVWVEYGEWKEIGAPKTEKIPATPENVDDLFRQCDRLLGNEGLHIAYWRSRRAKDNPIKAKLELYGILRDGQAWSRLTQVCQAKIDELFEKYESAILKLTTSRQEVYNRIRRSGKDPEPERLFISPNIALPRALPRWENHLYIEPAGGYGADLNTWESDVLKDERKKAEFAGWFRNPWSLCLPYKFNHEWKSLYPDLVIFRTVNGQTLVDLLDPHDSALADSVAKAKGLIDYAQKHGQDFDRIQLIIKDATGRLRRLDLKDAQIQARVLALKDTEPGELTKIIDEIG
jgi:type III restriction enzyme